MVWSDFEVSQEGAGALKIIFFGLFPTRVKEAHGAETASFACVRVKRGNFSAVWLVCSRD
jgi:hypothetical protein